MSAELQFKNLVLRRRGSKRSRVHLEAEIEAGGRRIEVELRDLSQVGALVCGRGLPNEGSEVTFIRDTTSAPARIAWVDGTRAGLEFAERLSEDEVRSHVGATVMWAALAPTETFRRTSLNREEQAMLEKWERLVKRMDGKARD